MSGQYIFIDDSGDPGFKFKKHSSRFFVICCIIFNSKTDAEKTSTDIKLLKHNLGLKADFELKFSKASPKWREKILYQIKQLNFSICAIAVDKTKINSKNKGTAATFYQSIIREILYRYSEMSEAKVYLDGSGGRNYRLRNTTYFRKELNMAGRKKLQTLKIVNSKNDNLIQLADFIAGAIQRKYEKNNKTYYRLIRHKITDLYEYNG